MNAIETKIQTLSNIQDTIKLRKATEEMALERKINEMKDEQKIMNHFSDKLNEKLPSIINTLESLHLGIETIGYGKTSNNMYLRVSINAVPISDKFKFITDKGFTAKGSGKNDQQLENKAAKLENKIKEGTSIDVIHINKYSLEVKNIEDKGSVMIELWIK